MSFWRGTQRGADATTGMVRALPSSQQPLSSSSAQNGEPVSCKVRPRLRVAVFAATLGRGLTFGKQRHRICFQVHVCFANPFCSASLFRSRSSQKTFASLYLRLSFHRRWLVSYSVSQSLERVGDAMALNDSRHLTSATTAQKHIWSGTSTVPPNQNKETEQTLGKSARLNV